MMNQRVVQPGVERVVQPGLAGFVIFEKTDKGDGYIGALMVTDERGYPLEFKATTPVRPSLVQKTLYGKQLENFIGVELCGKTLVQQSSRKAKAILVPERYLLDIADYVPISFITIRRAGESLQVDDGKATSARGTIKEPDSPFESIVYEGRFTDAEKQREIMTFLHLCASKFDLVEAFERMRMAIKLLGKEDPRYR